MRSLVRLVPTKRRIQELVRLVAGLALGMGLVACKKAPIVDAAIPVQRGAIAIAVTDDGFTPSKIRVAKGEPASLVFTRTAEHTCADRVKFPALGIDEALPLQKPVTIPLPTGDAKTLAFTCGMDMFASSVVIE